MAEELESFDWTSVTSRSKYPWELWFNGQPWRLQRGIDYECLDASIQGAAHKRCGENGVWVRTKITEQGVVVLQAFHVKPISELRQRRIDPVVAA